MPKIWNLERIIRGKGQEMTRGKRGGPEEAHFRVRNDTAKKGNKLV